MKEVIEIENSKRHQKTLEKPMYLDGGGDGDYEGFDQFGRIVDHRWEDVSASSNIDRYTHDYDRSSNRLYKENTETSGEDELYSYDNLNRLTNAERGDLNSNKDGINSKAFEQDWGLDISGNWSDFAEDNNGDGTFDLDQSREHNLVNEIDDTSGDGDAITETSGTSWADPDHDKAGNMTTVPKPDDLANTYTATYDAWNRLVKLEDSNGVVAEYEYDGLNRRIVEEADTDDDGTLDETRHVYYTQRWQRIEVRVGGTASGDLRKHWVWGTRYIDSLIQRKRDTGTDGSFDETHYVQQDANFRVTGVTDDTGSVVERYTFAAYGERTILDSDWSGDADGESDVDLRIGFQGRYHGAVIELMYFRNRYYHNRLGRFISRDLMGIWYDEIAYGNGYSAFGLNSIKNVDSFGLETYRCCTNWKQKWQIDGYNKPWECINDLTNSTIYSLGIGTGAFAAGAGAAAAGSNPAGWAIGGSALVGTSIDLRIATETCLKEYCLESKSAKCELVSSGYIFNTLKYSCEEGDIYYPPNVPFDFNQTPTATVEYDWSTDCCPE